MTERDAPPMSASTPPTDAPAALGIDIGGTNIKMVRVTAQGEILAQSQVPTNDGTDWIGQLREQIARIEAEPGGRMEHIGLAAPGLAARDGRSIAWMQGRLEAIQGVDWTTALGRARPVPVVNDAHAALLGEVWTGAARGSRNALLLTLGTGVGGAALVDGRLLRGHIGRAGHLGHISLDPDGPPDIVGTPGSLEDAIGDCTVARRSKGRFASTAQLVASAQTGDAEASALWRRSLHALACGIVSLINVLDPETVILGGGVIKAGPALLVPLQAELDRLEWRPTGAKIRLVPAALGEMAGAVGAAWQALAKNE